MVFILTVKMNIGIKRQECFKTFTDIENFYFLLLDDESSINQFNLNLLIYLLF